MLKYSSKHLTLNDVQAIETLGAKVAAKKNNIALPLATRCEKILQKKLIGGGSKGNRKLQKNDSSESELDSESDNMPMQNMPMQNMPMQNMPMQNMPMQNMPMQNMPLQGMPMQGMPLQNMPVQGIPIQGMPVQGQGQGKPQSMGQIDPLMLNYSAPIINQENVLGYLKQLNAI